MEPSSTTEVRQKTPGEEFAVAQLATTPCTCGPGPGCTPGTPPVCPTCARFAMAAHSVALRQQAEGG